MFNVLLVLFLINILAINTTSCNNDSSSENNTPIIGILSQETYIISSLIRNETFNSFIAASYVKFLESGGARVIPIWIGQNEDYYRRVVQYTNGILFPGGGTYFNETGGYGEAATYLYNIALEFNKNGTYFPIWGTCLGMEVFAYAALNGTKDIRVNCFLKNVAKPINLTTEYNQSRLFSEASNEILDILQTKNVNYNLHSFCLTQKVLKEYNLLDDWNILATNFDDNNLEFISVMEHRRFPFYGVQFHPEKNQFEFKKNKRFPHSKDSIKTAQYFGNFFVNECRRNDNTFPNESLEMKSLIYNYNPQYTGLNNSYYEQIYLFKKDDFNDNLLI